MAAPKICRKCRSVLSADEVNYCNTCATAMAFGVMPTCQAPACTESAVRFDSGWFCAGHRKENG